jgi:hypothetical protein
MALRIKGHFIVPEETCLRHWLRRYMLLKEAVLEIVNVCERSSENSRGS